MDNKEIIEALRCPGHNPIFHYCDKKSCIYCGYSCYDNLYRCNVQNLGLDAAAAMEKLTEEIDEWAQKAFTHQAAAVENLKERERLRAQVPKWTSVEDDPPEDEKPVIVAYLGYNDKKMHCDMVAVWHDNMWCYWDGYPCSYEPCHVEITHWMSLPELPSKKGGDTDADN